MTRGHSANGDAVSDLEIYMKPVKPLRLPSMLALKRAAGSAVVALSLTSCVATSTRIPDPACEHCYRTESGIPYKTWEAYDP